MSTELSQGEQALVDGIQSQVNHLAGEFELSLTSVLKALTYALHRMVLDADNFFKSA